MLPGASGCYVLTTFEGDILYIGLTEHLRRRFGQHLATKEKCQVTPRGKAFWFYFLEKPVKEIRRVERTWQNEYRTEHAEFPVLNKVASPIS
jgi:predicted GIY-YIG superfamily endonuclease